MSDHAAPATGAILVTGANGFVGRALVEHLLTSQPRPVIAAVRQADADLPPKASRRVAPALGPTAQWASALKGVECVVHAAARVHVMQDAVADPLQAFRQVNTAGTLALATQAAQAGVRRFVFISSIKVNGEQTLPGQAFTADQPPQPVDPYGVSKHEAEQGLLQVARETGMEVVIVRPVLVYGPGVGANVASMMRWLARGVPLPLGAIDNRRSLVSLANLVDFVALCVEHPCAANQVFLVSDGEDLSTTGLLRRMSRALGRRALLIPIPPACLALMARVLGKTPVAQRLLGSLQVDIEKNKQRLGWQPAVPVDVALQATARHFLELQRR
ncbi:SDR family oxidoreductase [Pseudomonas sp.]|uniref:UDP-glucose 4-epimerase family protein n=1 Tax=Pseudomonas sp. TaxID=306 RepID=UPI0028A8309B|nr:SDR family oxidoreductase [Pseudomonas sp.]